MLGEHIVGGHMLEDHVGGGECVLILQDESACR
jgi:hypothetical protein